jgi:hypothetical protein
MSKQPLLNLKQAAQALGIDEKSVQAKLVNGQLKGEKKSEWLQDKWFVYKRDVDDLVAKQKPKNGKRPNGAADSFKEQEHPTAPVGFELRPVAKGDPGPASRNRMAREESTIWRGDERDKVKLIVEQVLQPLVEKLAFQARLLAEKEQIIEDQAKQLRLLPDLQKQAAKEQEARETIVRLLAERAAIMEQENRKAELAKQKVGELEGALEKLKQVEAENKVTADRQILHLKNDKEIQVASLHQRLDALVVELEQAQRPWWKKILGASAKLTSR